MLDREPRWLRFAWQVLKYALVVVAASCWRFSRSSESSLRFDTSSRLSSAALRPRSGPWRQAPAKPPKASLARRSDAARWRSTRLGTLRNGYLDPHPQ